MKLELFVPNPRLKNHIRKSNFRKKETCNEALLKQF